MKELFTTVIFFAFISGLMGGCTEDLCEVFPDQCIPQDEEHNMRLYGGIDLHGNNNVTSLLDEEDRIVFERRNANFWL